MLGKTQVPVMQNCSSQNQVRLTSSHSPDGCRNGTSPVKEKSRGDNEVSTAPARSSRIPTEKAERCLTAQVRLTNSHSPDTERNGITSVTDKSRAGNEVSTAPARASRIPTEKTERYLMSQRPKSQPSASVVQAKLKLTNLGFQTRPCPLVADSSAAKAQDLKKGAVVSSASRLAQVRTRLGSQTIDTDGPALRHRSESRTHTASSATGSTTTTATTTTPSPTTPTTTPTPMTSPTTAPTTPSGLTPTLRPTLGGKQHLKPTASLSGHRIGIGATSGARPQIRSANTGSGTWGKVSSPRSQCQAIASTFMDRVGTHPSDSLSDAQGGKSRTDALAGNLPKDPSAKSILEKRSLLEGQARTQGSNEAKATAHGIVKTASVPGRVQATLTSSAYGYPQTQNSTKLQTDGRLTRTTAQPLGFVGSRPLVQSATAPTSGSNSFALRGRSSSPNNVEANPPVPGRPSSPVKPSQAPPVSMGMLGKR